MDPLGRFESCHRLSPWLLYQAQPATSSVSSGLPGPSPFSSASSSSSVSDSPLPLGEAKRRSPGDARGAEESDEVGCRLQVVAAFCCAVCCRALRLLFPYLCKSIAAPCLFHSLTRPHLPQPASRADLGTEGSRHPDPISLNTLSSGCQLPSHSRTPGPSLQMLP